VPFAGAPAAMLHAWQSVASPPPHALAQHTPSTQNPDVHWFVALHVAPFGCFA
jgi:hypothetical protein